MRISAILEYIDQGHIALPEFQRGYVWNRDQVRDLMRSLYRRHPVGSLLVWVTQSESAGTRGDAQLASGVVKLLLDGQQRVTTLYGIVRGAPPKFFDGNAHVFAGLHFHLDREEFHFYQPVKMAEDPAWIDVTKLMKGGLGPIFAEINSVAALQAKFPTYADRLTRLHSALLDTDLHIEEVTGPDKTVSVVVDIFNKVNSGGTKLSQGDLALAKICAESPTARDNMKQALARWGQAGYQFSLDWLLRNVNTISRGEAKFEFMHDVDAATFADGLGRARRAIDYLLYLVSGRLGLDHDRVLFGRYAFPVMVRYLDRRGGRLTDTVEQGKLLYWYLHSALWGRFSGSTESFIDKDLGLVDPLDGAVDRLIEELRVWRGSLEIQPAHFSVATVGSRFYPLLYLLTRVGDARDWGTGLPLRSNLLGTMNQLEVHHIFPKARLKKLGHRKGDINAVANFCFLTKDTNLKIGAQAPAVYFEEIEKAYPGALASQWIPTDRELWKDENYFGFLDARRKLLAEAANKFLDGLLHSVAVTGEDLAAEVMAAAAEMAERPEAGPIEITAVVPGVVSEDSETQELLELNAWVIEQGLPAGHLMYELAGPSGDARAILDLAWPNGLQEGYSQPVALMIDDDPDVQRTAVQAGFRFFTDVEEFKGYARREILAGVVEALPVGTRQE